MKTSPRIIENIATLVWVIGSIALIRKGFLLLIEADAINSQSHLPPVSILVGFWLGIAKGKYVFAKSWLQNRERIYRLKQPKLWQFFTPGFFVALAVMITGGVFLSVISHGDFPLLIAVGILDLAIGTALASGRFFFIYFYGDFETAETYEE